MKSWQIYYAGMLRIGSWFQTPGRIKIAIVEPGPGLVTTGHRFPDYGLVYGPPNMLYTKFQVYLASFFYGDAYTPYNRRNPKSPKTLDDYSL
jgi:hypothetical protein